MSDFTIIYDDSCPMCKRYTRGFEQAGWLGKNGKRVGFSEAARDEVHQLDIDRARHEIPLIDHAQGRVLYGKEALFRVLSCRFPFFDPLFRNGLFRAFIHALYQVITYNRRVIAASRPPATGFDCAPDYHAGWRWTYIGIAVALGTLLAWAHGDWRFAGIAGGVLLVASAAGIAHPKWLTWLGHTATVWVMVQGLLALFCWIPLLYAPAGLPLQGIIGLAGLWWLGKRWGLGA